jgi:hypothetical protein
VLRAVLRQWDFRDEEGWRPLVQRFFPAGGPAGEGGAGAEVGGVLGRFAASELRRQLAEARACRREVEYLLDLSTPAEPLPVVSGSLDCLWQDADGHWHLLFYTAEPVPAGGRDGIWRERRLGLVLAAEAVRRQTGSWPRGVVLHSLADGGSVRRAGGRLQPRAALAGAAAALSAFSRQPLTG